VLFSLVTPSGERGRASRPRAAKSTRRVNQSAAGGATDRDRQFAIGRQARRLQLGIVAVVAPAAARHLSDDAAAHAHLLSNGALGKLALIEQPANFQD